MLALLCWGAGECSALSRVTLRNGFSYDCARQQNTDAQHTRLFLSAADDASFVDVPTAEILSVDELPPPAAPPAAATSAKASPGIPELLHTAGTAHNIDVDLLASVIHAESSGHTHAISRTGAQGLMQLMPSTAHALGVLDSFEPGQNINGGTAYLDALLVRYHDNLALALAAYNAGPGAVDRYRGVPPFRETRAYVVRVINEFKRRKALLERNGGRGPADHALQASR